jgi:formylglycine-generating enzyme required for sulfatase activity
LSGHHARALVVLVVASVAPAGLSGCRAEPEPIGQVVLHVDTNAFVPPPPGALEDPLRPREPPLVDRVRFEVAQGGRPLAEASREFALDEALFRASRVSIGVVPPTGAGDVTVRVRLYRADRSRTLAPPAGVTLDTTVRLPPVPAEGKTDVSLFLDAEDFGRTVGQATPVDPQVGRPTLSQVGTWARGRRLQCAAAAPLGSASSCVAGGAFFLGEPALAGRTRNNDITEERLVVVAPFYLDQTEVTVAAFRDAWPSLKGAGVAPPLAFSGKRDGANEEDWCTWSATPTLADGRSLERLPLNCVSWNTAQAYCRALGGDLPSEAQYEFVMSGQGRELAYPWGNEDPDCSAAVWARAGIGALRDSPGDCRVTPLGGVEYAGSGTRDRVLGSDGAPIVDLAGNLSEWTRDLWSAPTEAFWNTTLPMTDPVANLTSALDGDRRAVRGGTWLSTAVAVRAGLRFQSPPNDQRRGTGFRCARAAQPR